MFIRHKTEGQEIRVAIPLTATSGKARIKRRAILNAYGAPVATRQINFTPDCYVEWQIGYDVVIDDPEKLQLTSLAGHRFTGANGKTKALYELSEYVFWLTRWNLVSKDTLQELQRFLRSLAPPQLFDAHPDLVIRRSHLLERIHHGISFRATRVEYPVLIHELESSRMAVEIIIQEKQRAVGVQPMLYLCLPVSDLVPVNKLPPLLGRTAHPSEQADLIIHRENAAAFVQVLRLFGMLSESHRWDVTSIVGLILAEA